MLIKAGATSRSIDIWVPDSASTTGAGKTGLAYNTASLKAYYRKGATGSATAITLATQTVGGAFSSGGFVEVDATNMPGLYRFDIPNAAIDTAGFVHIVFSGASGMAPVTLRIQCVAFDPEDTVRMGLTALPNAAAGANGGLPLGDASGRVDIGKLLGTAWLTPAVAGTPDVNVKLWNSLTTVALPLCPTIPGRTLDVSTGGEAGLDWANVGSPSTVVSLSSTTVATINTISNSGSDALADRWLDRALSAGANASTDTARTVRNALRALRNKAAISGSTLTVFMEDDTTAAFTAAVTGTAGADPVTAVDPT